MIIGAYIATPGQSFSTTEQARGTLLIEMGHAVTLDYDPSGKGRQAVGTARLCGCIAVSAVFRGGRYA